ncbi:MAG: hypothetical protein U5O39_03420 [Gammaproteobacteria bacterium]|nr:hypothetical protein [Gammaproteobacteria bacterium]
MAVISELTVKLGGDNSGLTKTLQSVSRQMRQTGQDIARAGSQ